jgi:hypothetical protein
MELAIVEAKHVGVAANALHSAKRMRATLCLKEVVKSNDPATMEQAICEAESLGLYTDIVFSVRQKVKLLRTRFSELEMARRKAKQNAADCLRESGGWLQFRERQRHISEKASISFNMCFLP